MRLAAGSTTRGAGRNQTYGFGGWTMRSLVCVTNSDPESKNPSPPPSAPPRITCVPALANRPQDDGYLFFGPPTKQRFRHQHELVPKPTPIDPDPA
jgi:hypothetical protein